MNLLSVVSEEQLQLCQNISDSQSLAALKKKVSEAATGLPVPELRLKAAGLDPTIVAKALLLLAGLGERVEPQILERGLAAQNAELVAAAAFAVACCHADDIPLLRHLLLGRNSFEPSPITPNGRYWIISFLGFSGNPNCVEVLLEAIRDHSHFCPLLAAIQAVEALGQKIPADSPFRKSISVDPGQGTDLQIYFDDKFSGSSNCNGCRFFPCRINRYYPGAIEDCSLWNRTDPATFGGLHDRRFEQASPLSLD